MQDGSEAQQPGRRPDFLLIGAMKAGTSTLHDTLARHPGLFLSTPKEPQFFSRDEVFARGFAWYEGLFEAAGERPCGESSTCYSRWPHHGEVAERIAAHLPDVRLIYQMRHPVERAYSHYRHLMQERIARDVGDLPSFEEMLEEDAEILDASRYMQQIERFLAHYPRERFFFLLLEDLEREPDHTLGELQRFLGVPVRDLVASGPVHSNRFGDKLAIRDMHRWLTRVSRSPWFAPLVPLFAPGLRARVRRRLTDLRVARRVMGAGARAHGAAIGPLRPETRARLVATLRDDNARLASFLGRDLAPWNA